MKKKDNPVITDLLEGEVVIITDKRSDYVNRQGSIKRIGYAGDYITYYHVLFENHITPITFTTQQVERITQNGN